jgi:hypothetical protein
MWARREQLEDMPGHHFSNSGGVVMIKQFLGFEKYHRSNADVIGWYEKAFPAVFEEKKEEE